jgi:sialic acid synthase SpsE
MHVSAPSLRAFFERYELDEDAHRAVAARARAHGLAFVSTPFDEDAVALLERVGCDAYKIASGDITHLRLIDCAAATGRPLIISTGMSEQAEVARALDCARAAGATAIALLHCVSAYPVPAGEENLRAIATLASRFDVPVGLSDHSKESFSAVVAVALGASVYERHLVADPADEAIDAPVSASPGELAEIVRTAARVQRALGDGRRTCGRSEQGNRMASRRGLYASRDLAPGAPLCSADLVALRPEGAVPASSWAGVLGRCLEQPLAEGAPLPAGVLEGLEEAS